MEGRDADVDEHWSRRLSSALKELHRALLRAEIGDDPALQRPYTQLFALIGDPRFAWLAAISQFVTRIDEALDDAEVDPAAMWPEWHREAAGLIGHDGAEGPSAFRLQHLMAVQKDPHVGMATGGLRKVLNERPRD